MPAKPVIYADTKADRWNHTQLRDRDSERMSIATHRQGQ